MGQDKILHRLTEVVEDLIRMGDIESKSKFAKEAGLSPQHLNEILKGRTKIPLNLIALLHEKHLVSTEYLLVGIGNPFKHLSIPNSEINPHFFKLSAEFRNEEFDTKTNETRKVSHPDFDDEALYISKNERLPNSEKLFKNEIDKLNTEILHLKTKNTLLEKQLLLQEDLIKEYKRRLREDE